MLRDANIDAVVVCVEPVNFVPLVKKALESGKHVLWRGALCDEYLKLLETIVAVERSGLIYQMAEQMRFSPL